jgi:hypothetical protein
LHPTKIMKVIVTMNKEEVFFADQLLIDELESAGSEIEYMEHQLPEGFEECDGVLERGLHLGSSIKQQLNSADLIIHRTQPKYLEGDEFNHLYSSALELTIRHHLSSKCESLSSVYNTSFKIETHKIAKQHGIPMPKSWTVDQWFEGKRELPVVLKHNYSRLGEGVLFIDSLEQIKKFWNISIYKEHGINDIVFTDSGPPQKHNYLVEECIQCPTDYFTTFRVLAVAGKVLGAEIIVSDHKKMEFVKKYSTDVLFDPTNKTHTYDHSESPLYLDRLDICSNSSKNIRRAIPLSPNERSKPISKDDEKILEQLGYDPKNPIADPKLIELAEKVSSTFKNCGVAYAGIDIIQNRKTGEYLLLELNQGPGAGTFNVLHSYGIGNDETGLIIGMPIVAATLIEIYEQH